MVGGLGVKYNPSHTHSVFKYLSFLPPPSDIFVWVVLFCTAAAAAAMTSDVLPRTSG